MVAGERVEVVVVVGEGRKETGLWQGERAVRTGLRATAVAGRRAAGVEEERILVFLSPPPAAASSLSNMPRRTPRLTPEIRLPARSSLQEQHPANVITASHPLFL